MPDCPIAKLPDCQSHRRIPEGQVPSHTTRTVLVDAKSPRPRAPSASRHDPPVQPRFEIDTVAAWHYSSAGRRSLVEGAHLPETRGAGITPEETAPTGGSCFNWLPGEGLHRAHETEDRVAQFTSVVCVGRMRCPRPACRQFSPANVSGRPRVLRIGTPHHLTGTGRGLVWSNVGKSRRWGPNLSDLWPVSKPRKKSK